MIKITPKLLRTWGACWSDEQIADAFDGRRFVTPRQVASADNVSLKDRLWVLTQTLAHLDESAARGFAVECALSVVHNAGEYEDELRGILNDIVAAEDLPESAARSAAYSAAYSAARSAACGAARSAAYSAASAAYSAACDAAYSAACDAAYSAACDAVRSVSLEAACDAVRSSVACDAVRSVSLEAAIARALEWLS